MDVQYNWYVKAMHGVIKSVWPNRSETPMGATGMTISQRLRQARIFEMNPSLFWEGVGVEVYIYENKIQYVGTESCPLKSLMAEVAISLSCPTCCSYARSQRNTCQRGALKTSQCSLHPSFHLQRDKGKIVARHMQKRVQSSLITYHT